MFLQASLGAVAAVVGGCSGESENPDGGGGELNGGSGGSTRGSGGSASGAAPNGSGSATQSGGAASGGSNAGSGGAATAACTQDIDTLSSFSDGGSGHQHRLVVTKAIIDAGVDVDVRTSLEPEDPSNSHCHQISLSSADLAILKGGGTVKKITCNGGDHEFVLSCAAGADEPVPVPESSCPGSTPGACL